jgi:hypothetical protein
MESSGSSILRRGENENNDLVNSSMIICVARLLEAGQHISDPHSSHTEQEFPTCETDVLLLRTQLSKSAQLFKWLSLLAPSRTLLSLARSLAVDNDDDEVIQAKVTAPEDDMPIPKHRNLVRAVS